MAKTKRTPKIVSLILTVIMLVGMLAILPIMVSAEDGYTSVAIPVKKSMTADSDIPPVNQTFTFNISRNASNSTAPLPDTLTCSVTGIGQTAFNPIYFTSPGNYYYDITETHRNIEGYIFDSAVYTVCIEVKNNPNVSGALTAKIVAIYKTGETRKQDLVEFKNEFKLQKGKLTLSKEITGELADMKKGFEFYVALTDTSYSQDFGAKGKITNGAGYITLHNNESIEFDGLRANTRYTITENGADAYLTSIDNNGTALAADTKSANGPINAGADVKVKYTNNMPYNPVVGLNLTVIPFVVLVALGIAVPAIIVYKKHNSVLDK